LTDSEGAGRFRGAPGAYVEFGPVEGELEVVYLSDGTHTSTRGVRGGLGGAPARPPKRDTGGGPPGGPGCYAHVKLQPGETIVSMTCGGGGYGPPTDRDPARVEKDVREGWITAERAAEVYGVVIDEEQRIDRTATEQRRAAARRER